jgi:sterol desaturase/sphingolipid hydroxylase (fatty acid hydroxylase superfamily)
MEESKEVKVEVGKLRKSLGFFAKTSPYAIIPLDLLIITLLIIYGVRTYGNGMLFYWWLYPTGIFTWTLIEYLMHRYTFHYDSKSETGKKGIYLLHGIHHDHPTDGDKLYQPPLVNLVIITLLWGFFYLVMGRFVYMFLPGIITGYLLYSTIHYVIHKFKPPFEWLKPLWRHHNLHHYRYQDKAFGVSSPLWDYVFRTLPPKEIKK